jgi:hypothetical protein
VISSAGSPEEQPDLKKPTALRGAVGVWDRESGDCIKGLLAFWSNEVFESRKLLLGLELRFNFVAQRQEQRSFGKSNEMQMPSFIDKSVAR